MFNKKRLEELALDFIGKNYGLQEQEEPSYNIKMMVDYMVENYDKDNIDNYNYVRHCDECGQEMWEGYCIDNGRKYYCCADCLDKNYTEEEWEDLYASGDSYYTDWHDEMKKYYNIEDDD